MIFDERRTERYYCKDENGRDLFYFELVIDNELAWIYMNSSLQYDFTGNSRVEKLCTQITEFSLSEIIRSNLIEELFALIKTLPGIEKYFFSPEFLDKNGKHLPEYSAVIENLIQHKDFPDYSVFSRNNNSFYFDYSLPFLLEKLTADTSKQIDKIYFEKLVQRNITLMQEYVEWLSNNSEYFHVFLFDQKTQYDCFIMMEQEEIKLFFVRQAIPV